MFQRGGKSAATKTSLFFPLTINNILYICLGSTRRGWIVCQMWILLINKSKREKNVSGHGELRPTPDAVVLLLPRPRTSWGGTVFVVIGRVGGLLEPLNKHSWFYGKNETEKNL